MASGGSGGNCFKDSPGLNPTGPQRCKAGGCFHQENCLDRFQRFV